MKIFIRDITDKETRLQFDERENWVTEVVEQIDEQEQEAAVAPRPPALAAKATSTKTAAKRRAVRMALMLHRVGEVYIVQGSAQAEVFLNCSRCVARFALECRSNFSLLYSKNQSYTATSHRHVLKPEKEPREPRPSRFAHDPSEGDPSKGDLSEGDLFEGDPSEGDQPEIDPSGIDLSESDQRDVDIAYLEQDFIDLSDILSEQLQLQIPFQPLCKADCKGICQNCGTNLNLGRCACKVIKRENPFSVLKDFKTGK